MNCCSCTLKKNLQQVTGVFTTKCVAQTDFIFTSFLKCGISNSYNGSEYHVVSILQLEHYSISKLESESHLLSDEAGAYLELGAFS